MRRPNPRHEDRNTTSITAWLPVLAAMAVMVTGCLSTFLVLQLDEFRPNVGDVVVFRPGSQDADMWQMTVPATVVNPAVVNPAGVNPAGTMNQTCSLDPNIIATDGGSLLVERRQETPVLDYQVHWAGKHTDKNSDCGANADLIVSRTDLQRLANAAGGFGIGDKGITH